jgi:hypothetical protein
VGLRCSKVSQDPCQDLSFQLAGAPPQRLATTSVDPIKVLRHELFISDIMG